MIFSPEISLTFNFSDDISKSPALSPSFETTFFVLLVIFIFGGEVIRGFMFALMIGVIVGTYSSLFIASPIMLDTMKKKGSN